MKTLFLIIFLFSINSTVIADMVVDLSQIDQSFLEDKNCKTIEQLRLEEYLKSKKYKKIIEIGERIAREGDYFDEYVLYYQAVSEYRLKNYSASIEYLDKALSAKSECKLTELFGGTKELKLKLRDQIIYFNISEIYEAMGLKSLAKNYSISSKRNLVNIISDSYGDSEENIKIMNRILSLYSLTELKLTEADSEGERYGGTRN